MNPRKVLFVGGNAARLASVQIRCVDVAQRLGCDYLLELTSIKQLPRKYSAFVFVKSTVDVLELEPLSKRGVVIWDIIDAMPPKDGVDLYLASTRSVQHNFRDFGRVEYIPHHHCNRSSTPNNPRNRRPAWIGGRHWHPALRGFPYQKFYVEGMTQNEVVRTLRKIGIGLNFRNEGIWRNQRHPGKLYYDFHVALNSGIKLINCLGFGIPSVSGEEPAYQEIGAGCTIFSSQQDCAHWVRELRSNNRLYDRLRRECLRHAAAFHLDAIAEKYRRLFQSL